MKYHLHNNGWTVILDDFNVTTATQEDVNQIACLIATNTLVIIPKQGNLSVDDQIRFSEMLGVIENFSAFADKDPYPHILVPESQNKVMRVTGMLDEHGEPGVFGHVSELDWHVNQPANPNRRSIVWLYGVQGTVGSKTSFTNNIMAYNDLDAETLEKIKDLKYVCGWRKGNYSDYDFGKLKGEGVTEMFNEAYNPPVIYTNNGSKTGIFFPFLQFRNFMGYTEEQSIEIIKPLINHIIQDKYMYTHEWQDTDVLLSEQWLGVHKRWEFEHMDQRILYRIETGFENCDLSAIR
jgi:alpha-ketoglutarate-dependent taurine dioxygenase